MGARLLETLNTTEDITGSRPSHPIPVVWNQLKPANPGCLLILHQHRTSNINRLAAASSPDGLQVPRKLLPAAGDTQNSALSFFFIADFVMMSCSHSYWACCLREGVQSVCPVTDHPVTSGGVGVSVTWLDSGSPSHNRLCLPELMALPL